MTPGQAPGGLGSDGGRFGSARSVRNLARTGAVAAYLLIAVVGTAAPASAHVTITPSTTAAGAHAVLEVSVGHGCEGSSTTAITIQIPAAINAVTPTRNALWEVEKQTVKVDPPATDSHGSQVSERTASVTYSTDTALPEGYRDVFELSLQLPDTEGTTLVFPTIQTCEGGEAAWIEVPQSGQSGEDLELPAPAFTITAAEGGEHGQDASVVGTATDPAVDTSGEPGAAEDPAPSRTLALGGLGAGVLGTLLGGAALALSRRRR